MQCEHPADLGNLSVHAYAASHHCQTVLIAVVVCLHGCCRQQQKLKLTEQSRHIDESEIAHLSELAELRERVMELQTKDSHTPDELAELDMLRNRVLGFQASTPGLPIPPAAFMQDSSTCATTFAKQLPLLTS